MRRARAKRKRKVHNILSDDKKKEFAQKFLNGKMIKQLISDYNISINYGYGIIRELLEWKLEWRNKEILND